MVPWVWGCRLRGHFGMNAVHHRDYELLFKWTGLAVLGH